MPIRRLLEQESLDPEAVRTLVAAFEGALTELRLVDRNDPVVDLVGKRIIQFAQEGERDPAKLKALRD